MKRGKWMATGIAASLIMAVLGGCAQKPVTGVAQDMLEMG